MMTIKSSDLSIIKVALEHATFNDYRVRDAIDEVIKNLDLDLDEISFDPSPICKTSIQALEDLVTEIETGGKGRRRTDSPLRLDVDADLVEVKSVSDDIDSHIKSLITDKGDETPARKTVNVDEELAEYDPS